MTDVGLRVDGRESAGRVHVTARVRRLIVVGMVVLLVGALAAASCQPKPTIAAFSPSSGGVGTTVTVTGTHFVGVSAVRFNGAAASFSVQSGTSLTAVVPAGSTTGPVSVTTSGGTAVSGSAFTVTFPTPIRHVVVIDQENHSFDNVLGKLCVLDGRCDGSTTGKTLSGQTVPLSQATDAVIPVSHLVADQTNAIDGGKMDGWERIGGCQQDQCLTQYDPSQIPVVAALARSGVIADRYFSADNAPSFGSHLFFTNQTLDGFDGNNPKIREQGVAPGPGWGCDSNLQALWNGQLEPSCIPKADGTGAYKPTPVPHTDTVMDRLGSVGRSWRIYAQPKPKPRSDGTYPGDGYHWNPCTYNADCIHTTQVNNVKPATQIVADANAGQLPTFSLVVPSTSGESTSQHNGTSMIAGDNWIGQIVQAIENGPDGATTTIFITWDDCGCFYDHAPPPAGYGIRLPLVIVSPYAKPSYTDKNFSTTSSILAYMEYVLSVPPVEGNVDGSAYNFNQSFNYSQIPRHAFVFKPGVVSEATKNYLKTHPAAPDDDT